MGSLIAIAVNTFKETVRDRVLYAFVFFACLFTLGGILLGSLSIAEQIRVLADVGLFVIATIGGVIAIFVGTNLVFKEIDRRTIYLLLTKPVARWQFLAGKFLGLSMCIAVITAMMGIFLMMTIWFQLPDHVAAGALMKAIAASVGLIYLELLFVIALAVFFSTFCTPLMSVLFTLGLWIIGHLSPSLIALGQMSTSGAAQQLAQFIYYVLPDLSQFSKIQDDMMRIYEMTRHAALEGVHLKPRTVNLQALPMVLGYVLGYIVLLLSFGTFIIERREFN